jgi:class 3 adenylate cyclase/tetratricopeptide (TPR) repeat protein
MKRVRLAFLIIFFALTRLCLGQDPVLDSLKLVLENAAEDTNKVNTLIEICKLQYWQSPADAIVYGNEARALSQKLGYNKGLANAYKYIGMGHFSQGDYWETVNQWQQALSAFEAINDKVGISNMLNNIGVVYNNRGDDTNALEYYLRSLKPAEEIRDTLRIVTALTNIGTIYLKKNSLDEALEYYLAALPMSEQIQDADAEGTASVNIGEIYFAKEAYDTALYYYEKSLVAYQVSTAGNVPFALTCIGKVYMERGDFQTAIKFQNEAYEVAKLSDAKLEMTGALLGLAETYTHKGDLHSAILTYKRAQEIAEDIGFNYERREAYRGLADAYAELSDFDNAYKYQSLLTDINDTLYEDANAKTIQAIQFNYEIEKREGQIELLTTDKLLQEAIIQKQKFVKNAFIIGFILIMLVALQTLRNYFRKVKTNKLLDKQKVEIENLVLNILPAEVATELRTEGSATPRSYESVSVLFTDFKGFTQIAGGLTPKELVAELNEFFIAFDEIAGKNNLEKIKTIGDAYMCAGGIPSQNKTHPFDTVKAGLEMQAFMDRTNKLRESKGQQIWGLRIGIHTGPLVAGVVGKKKFAYDIWGNAVNIASRMESSGEAGRVNISAATHALVCKQFNCEFRGKIYAKNVGDIEMYFVEPLAREPYSSISQKETVNP